MRRSRPRIARRALIAAAMAAAALAASPVSAAGTPLAHKVGQVTWHPRDFAGQTVTIIGYVLAREAGYILFSDEASGRISVHDLPVAGMGVEDMQVAGKYRIEGVFLRGGLAARNGNPYHLELTVPPAKEPR